MEALDRGVKGKLDSVRDGTGMIEEIGLVFIFWGLGTKRSAERFMVSDTGTKTAKAVWGGSESRAPC